MPRDGKTDRSRSDHTQHNKAIQQEALVRLCRLLSQAQDRGFKGSVRIEVHAKYGRLFDLRTSIEESTTIAPTLQDK